MMFSCTQKNLIVHILVYLMNISVLVSDYCIVCVQALVICVCNTKIIPLGNYSRLRTIKHQHRVADMSYPPQKKRVTGIFLTSPQILTSVRPPHGTSVWRYAAVTGGIGSSKWSLALAGHPLTGWNVHETRGKSWGPWEWPLCCTAVGNFAWLLTSLEFTEA